MVRIPDFRRIGTSIKLESEKLGMTDFIAFIENFPTEGFALARPLVMSRYSQGDYCRHQ